MQRPTDYYDAEIQGEHGYEAEAYRAAPILHEADFWAIVSSRTSEKDDRPLHSKQKLKFHLSLSENKDRISGEYKDRAQAWNVI